MSGLSDDQVRPSSSPEVDQVAPAFVKAMSEVGKVAKTRDAKIEPKDGGRAFSYTYANINDVLASVKPIFAEHDLAISQPSVATDPGHVHIVTRVWHSSGQWIQDDGFRLPVANEARKVGTGMTYARRYALTSFLGLETPDDDGHETDADIQRQIDEENERRDAEEKMYQRVTAVLDDASKLDDAGKEAIKAWKMDRRIARPELMEDLSWLETVETWLDEYAASQTSEEGS